MSGTKPEYPPSWDLACAPRTSQVCPPTAKEDRSFRKDFYNRHASGLTVEPVHKKRVLVRYANSEDSGEPAHPRSLTRAFVVRTHCLWY